MTGKTKQAGSKCEESKPVSRISVRTLVEFLLRSGDIDMRRQRGPDLEAALLGARIHRKIQKSRKGLYASEVFLKYIERYEDLDIALEGRADGVFGDLEADLGADPGANPGADLGADPGADLGANPGADLGADPGADLGANPEADTGLMVEEIKGMYLDVTQMEEPYPVHLAQARCYAAMILLERNAPPSAEIGIRMTYVNLESEETKFFESRHVFSELKAWFRELLHGWHRWASNQFRHSALRDESMKELQFPFPYRQGQQKLTAAVYHTIREGKELFLMAPTGVGKTMSCVYPAVRAVGEGHGDKIFYLTGKNETLTAGREAFSILLDRGLDYRIVQITAKEKICPLNEPSCNPDDCPYAKGHFDRINDAVFDLLKDRALYDRETISHYAEEHKVCPFELTLDLASWCDAILCDYNYVFDPDASLKRFFANGAKGRYIFLIDEAHNLVERGRDMYSASVTKEHVLSAKRAAGKERRRLTKAFEQLNAYMLKMKHRLEEDPDGSALGMPYMSVKGEALEKLVLLGLRLFTELQTAFENMPGGPALREKLLDFYFELRAFLSAADYLDEHYAPYAEMSGDGEFTVRLFCVTPSLRLSEQLSKGRSAIFFSATLLPVDYFKRLLTVTENPYTIYAPSPFDLKRRLLLVARDVNTSYRNRGEGMYRKVAEYISVTAGAKTGNYMVFFPSYRMLKDVFEIYRREFDCPEVNWVVQSGMMQEADREIFLENFYEDPERSLVGFCVLGGMFSEGLDLAGTRLIGAIVVGAGIPQVSSEREILKRSYDEEMGEGFDYAYRYPGMNKVQQAAGRVIRTAEDIGVILLLDDRLLSSSSSRLFPREWRDYGTCTLGDARSRLREFWERWK